MTIRRVMRVLRAGVLGACLAAPASAADLHVDPDTGDDAAGDGSPALPWRTISHALASAQPGDVVRLEAGTARAATGEVFPLRVPPGVSVVGVSRAASRVEGPAGGTSFLVEGAEAATPRRLEDMTLVLAAVAIEIVVAPFQPMAPVVRRIDVALGTDGVFLRGSGRADLLVEDCVIDVTDDAFGLDGSNEGAVRIRGCTVAGAGTLHHFTDGPFRLDVEDTRFLTDDTAVLITVVGGGPASYRFARCRFDAGGWGILVVSTGEDCPAVVVDVERCTFSGRSTFPGLELGHYGLRCPADVRVTSSSFTTADGIATWDQSEAGPARVAIDHCTLTGIDGIGIVGYMPAAVDVRNSILRGASPVLWLGDGVAFTGCDVEGAAAAPGSGNFDVDPLFDAGAAEPHRLLPASPCIDRASAPGTPLVDIDGQPRFDVVSVPDGGSPPIPFADVGADEWVPPGADFDGDTVPDETDVCPLIADAGQADADGDGAGDACDPCPMDAPDDDDGDGACDGSDVCPGAWDPDQADADGDLAGDACDDDDDGDGVADADDTCRTVADPAQADTDADGAGDACDPCPLDALDDEDGDGACADADNCDRVANPGQEDADADARGDACDACPGDPLDDADGDGACGDEDNCPSDANPGQLDLDADGEGDACDDDDDGDGVDDAADVCPTTADPAQLDSDADGAGDACDPCPLDALDDEDGDGACADADNCPAAWNPAQEDRDGDGEGDACDEDDDGDGLRAVDDCDDEDAGLLRPPIEVTGLQVASSAGGTLLAWDAQDAWAGSAVVHDVVAGPLAWDRATPWGRARCVASGVAGNTLAVTEGSAWFLVRARSGCGVATFGRGSDSARRELDVFPCP